jgi:hypothetical protein
MVGQDINIIGYIGKIILYSSFSDPYFQLNKSVTPAIATITPKTALIVT